MIDGFLLARPHTLATLRAQRTIQATLGFSNGVFFRKAQLNLFEVPLALGDG